MPGEFDIIQNYFAPLAGPAGLSLQDDVSVCSVPPDCDLVVTKDVLNEGIHFRPEDPPDLVAYKTLAVSVSDCISKGARPEHYWLGLSLPAEPENKWIKEFTRGLMLAQNKFGCVLAGGDTTRTLGPSSVSVTVAGFAPSGKIVRRAGAQVGDAVYVTGELGNAALALHALVNNLACPSGLLRTYQAPEPPYVFGPKLIGVANASADVSDGLVADAGHIAAASGVLMQINQQQLPVGKYALGMIKDNPQLECKIWSGGDDYQILFTAPRSLDTAIQNFARESKTLVTNIGEVTQGKGVHLLDRNQEIVQVTSGGYEHF